MREVATGPRGWPVAAPSASRKVLGPPWAPPGGRTTHFGSRNQHSYDHSVPGVVSGHLPLQSQAPTLTPQSAGECRRVMHPPHRCTGESVLPLPSVCTNGAGAMLQRGSGEGPGAFLIVQDLGFLGERDRGRREETRGNVSQINWFSPLTPHPPLCLCLLPCVFLLASFSFFISDTQCPHLWNGGRVLSP